MAATPVPLRGRPDAFTMEASHSAVPACRALLALGISVLMLMNVRKTDVMRQLSATIPPGPSPAVASLGITGMGFSAPLTRFQEIPSQD